MYYYVLCARYLVQRVGIYFCKWERKREKEAVRETTRDRRELTSRFYSLPVRDGNRTQGNAKRSVHFDPNIFRRSCSGYRLIKRRTLLERGDASPDRRLPCSDNFCITSRGSLAQCKLSQIEDWEIWNYEWRQIFYTLLREYQSIYFHFPLSNCVH